MIEQDAVTGVDTVGVAVIHGHPMGIEFGCSVWAARRKRGRFALRTERISVHFAAGCLIELRLHAGFAESFKQTHRAESGYFACVFRYVETDPDMALCSEIVDFIRSNCSDDFIKRAGIIEIAIDQT